MDIIKYFKSGYNTRKELCIMTGLSDRKIRDEIENARKNGVIILNMQDGKGYYTTDKVEDLEKQYNQNQSRAMSILVQQKFLRKRIKQLKGVN